MSNLRIGIDIDEVLAEFVDAFLIFYNSKNNTNFKKSEIYDYHLPIPLNTTLENVVEHIEYLTNNNFYSTLDIVEGSIESIKKLKENDLFIVSARPGHVKDDTIKWVDKYYQNSFKEIHLVADKHGDYNFSKGDFATELGIKIFIEDSLKNSLDIASHGIHVILLDKPWNQEANLPENIYRVKDWNEILEKIDVLKEILI